MIINKVYLLQKDYFKCHRNANKPKPAIGKLLRRWFPYKFTFSFWIPSQEKKTTQKYRFLAALKHRFLCSVVRMDVKVSWLRRKQNPNSLRDERRFWEEEKVMNEIRKKRNVCCCCCSFGWRHNVKGKALCNYITVCTWLWVGCMYYMEFYVATEMLYICARIFLLSRRPEWEVLCFKAVETIVERSASGR